MLTFIKKMVGDKQEYRSQTARIAALPADYRFVLEKMQGYLWGQVSGDGSDTLQAQGQLLELLESGAAEGRRVLDVTGEDVTGFFDEFFRDTRKWTDDYAKRLGRNLHKKHKAQ